MQITLDHVYRWLSEHWSGGWGPDGWYVTDYAPEGFGEPGYQTYGATDIQLVITGNWWVRNSRHNERRDDKLLHLSAIYPRLWRALEELGVDAGCFDDEWTVHNGKAYRTTHDSYSWQPSLAYFDGDPFTLDELRECDFEPVINEGNGNDRWAFNMRGFDPGTMLPDGWESYNGVYANGWYDGQNDDPVKIGPRVRAEYEGHVDTLWVIHGVGQFDMHFKLYVRPHDDYQPASEDDDEALQDVV